jgi:hypothetical protein
MLSRLHEAKPKGYYLIPFAIVGHYGSQSWKQPRFIECGYTQNNA